jgi:hypothetical protein
MQVKSYSAFPQFFYHAIPSLQQSVRAPGNISTTATSYKGIQFTMTVWESREYMLQYLHTGAHLQAMKTGSTMGSYVKVFGDWWDTDENDIPNQSAREYGEVPVSVIIITLSAFETWSPIVYAAPPPNEKPPAVLAMEMTLFYFVTDVAMIPVVIIRVLCCWWRPSALLFGLSPFVTHQPICNMMM